MGTRSTIGVMLPDGTVKAVYCHWDGYWSHNGRILAESYQDRAKALELVEGGSISSLGPDIGVKHPFENPGLRGSAEYEAFKEKYVHMTKFYRRDRGESWADVKPKMYDNFEDFYAGAQEFWYILSTDGVWYGNSTYSDHPEREYKILTDAVAEALAETH